VRAQLQAERFWQFVTLNSDGSATATPLWVDIDGDLILVNTAIGRRKERNVRRDPRVVLALIGEDDPYEYTEIQGRVVEFVEGDEADASFDAFARKYQGRDAIRRAGEQRVLLRIEPTYVYSKIDPGSPRFRAETAS